LGRCLEKDPRRRIHDIADARLELDEKGVSDAAVPAASSRLLNRERVAWALLAAALSGVLAYSLSKEPPPAQVMRFQVNAPERASFGSSSGVGRADGTSGVALSPDGTKLVFTSDRNSLGERCSGWADRFFISRPLSGTEDALMPSGPRWRVVGSSPRQVETDRGGRRLDTNGV
jgi:hypothetical protein